MTAAELLPEKGWCPVAISYNTAPKLKMSVRVSSAFPSACSGDMYATVPSVAPVCVRDSSGAAVSSVGASAESAKRRTLAKPKSSSFAWPRAVTKMFAGVISRWMMPFACAASSASEI